MLEVRNPATAEVVTQLKVDDAQSIARKFADARSAQPGWASVPIAEKKKCIEKFRDSLVKNAPDLARTMTQETGKPVKHSSNEILATPARIDFFLQNVERVLENETLVVAQAAGDTGEVITMEPLGVIANISAWNYPYFVGSNVFIPALLTGNCVIYKPSEFAAMTGLAIEKLLHESGIPHNVFQAVIGAGSAGSEILKQKPDGVYFTGSYATGQKIAEAVGGLTHLQLELGGKDPAYVADDVNVEGAADALAEGAFYNAGQSCCAVERIYVHEKIYDRFVTEFTKVVKNYKTGDPMDESTFVGPLTREAQIGVLESQVKDAVASGAKLLTGGKRGSAKGNFFEPTVLSDVSSKLSVMKDESFGPIIGIQKVQSDEEAVALMNDTEYGLTAAVYSASEARAKSILSKINSGTVYWNCCDRVSPRLPWTGRKHSGIGSTLSLLGIRAFVQPKSWHMRLPKI